MQIHSLEVFRTVARHGSVTGAAQALGATQSAVSRQVAALEAETGARLFDRLPRGVALTEEGRCLLPHVEAILDHLSAARRDLDVLRGLGGGRLRVGAIPTAVAALVPRALAAFRDAHPGVTLSLVEGATPALLERLTAGDVDVAVAGAPPDGTRFDLFHLLDERLLVAVPRRHRLAGDHTVRLADLAEDPFLAGPASAGEPLVRIGPPPDFQTRVDVATAEWTGRLGCVAAGLGVEFVPALAVHGRPDDDIALLRLHADDAPARPVFAVTAAGRSRPPAVARFLAHLHDVAAQL